MTTLKSGQLLLLLLAACTVFADNDLLYEDSLEDSPGDYVPFDRLEALRKFLLWKNAAAAEHRREVTDEFDNWKGRWMPNREGQATPPPKIFPKGEEPQQDVHGVQMGKPSQRCDDAQTNLTVDWDYSPVNYTCYDSKIVPDRRLSPKLYCEKIPKYYVAMHKCMQEPINYDEDVPVYGTHRPLWPVYGEYQFLPRQRWLHSLEHGAIVMLYHPCANPLEIKRLKSLLTGCLRRHIISPYNLVDEDQPLVLLSWGCRLSMSYVNPVVVTKFIREFALRGPENIIEDGNFKEGLQVPAKVTSNAADSILCPNNP